MAYASQTGAAEQIAWRSANALAAAGFVRVAPLGSLTFADIAEAGTLLVVTSTYGAGEAPDSARAFTRNQMSQPGNFKGLDYTVLALGDMKYDATFCGFGRSVDRWLAAGKAKRLFDVICVDGDNDTAAMRKWCEQLTRLGAHTTVEALMPGPPEDWRLAERRLLNAGSPGGEAWHLALTAKNLANFNWTAGDIAEVWPRNNPSDVARFLSQHGLEGSQVFDWHGSSMALRDIIAHSRMPARHEVAGVALDWLVRRLQAYPYREYSIASLPDQGRMELLVRKAIKADGTLGLGSGWLTHHAAVGDVVKLRVRPNPNFHPPPDGPQILVGTGTGIAGLRAHLFHRQKRKLGHGWLVFGERSSRSDLYYAQDIRTWQSDGTLVKTDLVFSRDALPKKYVQDVIRDQAGQVKQWVMEQGASILVCGGLEMAGGVQDALAAILGEDKVDSMTQEGSYRRDIY